LDMKLLIDHREKERIKLFKDYISKNKSKFIKSIDIKQLPIADYATEDSMVGIEYKKDDFLESILDGRLDQQLKELSDNYDYPYLIIGFDGIMSLIYHFHPFNPRAIRGKLTSIVARNHITVLFCGDYLAEIVCDIIDKHYDGRKKSKEYSPIRKGHRKAQKRIVTTNEVKLDIISRLPTIGSERAEKLLESFNWSICSIANADVDRLTKIDGIGKKIAQQIKDVLE
jgi:ERCC4-type nuclease